DRQVRQGRLVPRRGVISARQPGGRRVVEQEARGHLLRDPLPAPRHPPPGRYRRQIAAGNRTTWLFCSTRFSNFVGKSWPCRMIRGMEQDRQVQAVQRLFVAHTSLLKGFILGLLPDYNRAEDVLQEVFLTLTQKADEFTPGTDFTAWARAVARIKVLHRYDQDKRAPRALCAEALDALVRSE